MVAPWATPADMVHTPCAAEDDGDVFLPWLTEATEVLYGLTGNRWPGVQTDTVRPCTPLHASGASAWCGCSGPSFCSCGGASMVELPGAPAVAVTSVHVDGAQLATSAYKLVANHLVRTEPGKRWPCCQDLTVAGTAAGGWQVVYTWGEAPPTAGVMAAAALACELWRAKASPEKCRLPKRVTTVARQGLSFAVLDPLTVFTDGMTGLPEVDLWLGSLRQARKNRPSTVMVPGKRARHLRTP